MAEEPERREGYVASYNESSGFGFIRPDSAHDVRAKSVLEKAGDQDLVLFRKDAVQSPELPRLVAGQRVSFVVTDDKQDLWTVVDRVRVTSLVEAGAEEVAPADAEYVDHYSDYDDHGWPTGKSAY